MENMKNETYTAHLGRVKLGGSHPVRVMGIINASRDSFHNGSVKNASDLIAELALKMKEEGADIIDVGGMSTAPAKIGKEVSVEEESGRLVMAIEAIKSVVPSIPISVNTPRSESATAALSAGASTVNDVSGLKFDPKMKQVVSKHNASVILMAHESRELPGSPINRVRRALAESLEIANEAGISQESVVLDVGLGFFRKDGGGFGFSRSSQLPWYVWDSIVIGSLSELRELGRPVCVTVSRKSFIGKLLAEDNPDERLPGSLAATSIAVFNGATLVRTHNVSATLQAVKVASAIRTMSMQIP
jgi:dihydropteroate synthase